MGKNSHRAALGLALAGLVVGTAAADEVAHVASSDTRITVQAGGQGLRLAALQDARGHEWIAAPGVALPLVTTLATEGKEQPVHWRVQGCERTPGRIVFTLSAPPLRATSTWQATSGPGPVEHTLCITNTGAQAIRLPHQTSLRFLCQAAPDAQQWWVEKSAGGATDVGVHREPITPGHTLVLSSSPYASDAPPREAIPWVAFQDVADRRGWYAGVEFSGRVQVSLRAGESDASGDRVPCPQMHVLADFGLADEAGYDTILAPGESFQAPPVFVGCYEGDVDDGSNRLRRWTESHIRPPLPDTRCPLLTNNSWGSGMAVDQSVVRTMVDESAGLGLELVHVDAGWFRSVGDWRPDAVKFPGGLAPLVAYAHQQGLKFGLWVGWTQGGIQADAADRTAILSVSAPDRQGWFTHAYAPEWKPSDFVGADLCLSQPPAVAWCVSLLDRLVDDFNLDLLEHDQRMVVDQCSNGDHSHTASPVDVAYRAALGYYQVYDTVRRQHPRLLFENCVNGGRMVDYGAARRAHYFSISDAYDPLSNRRAFYDASYALPASMCECYVQQEPVQTLPQFLAMLRSGMMGWCSIMCNTSAWTPAQHAAARREFARYKSVLRPLIQSGNLYHVAERPDGLHWDGMQFADPAGRRAVLFAFRGGADDKTHVFRLRGLDANALYDVSSTDGDTPGLTRRGQDLMRDGVLVSIDEPGASQLVLVQSLDNVRQGDSP